MTIAAGFQVDDGFVFCSDTESTTETLRLFRRKVLAPEVGECKYIYTGSGDSDFLKMAADKIEQGLHARGIRSAQEFSAVVEEAVLNIHERNIALYPDDPKPSFSMILGVLLNGQMSMLRTNATSVTMSGYGVECVGSGSTIGKFILEKLYCGASEILHATITAMYMLQQARTYAPGCGGLSHIYCLRKDGSFGIVSQNEIKAWERFFIDAELLARSFITIYQREHIFGSRGLGKEVAKLLRASKKLPKPYSEWAV